MNLPPLATHLDAIGGSVYSKLAHRLAAHDGEVYPFHVGDTWMEPAQDCWLEKVTVAAHPGMHRYTSTRGLPQLVDAIVDTQARSTGVPTTRTQVLVTAGATHGLATAVQALVNPGDEVLILAPFWPLIANHVRLAHGQPVPVPFFDQAVCPDSAVSALQDHLTDQTVAVYINTPHNPTGRIIPRAWLEAMVAWATSRGLWILADEVYEHHSYVAEHTYARSLAPERTIAVHSFSKAFGMAGNRCGYVVGPDSVMAAAHKVGLNTLYSVSTASQLAGLSVLAGHADGWLAESRRLYQSVGNQAADLLGVPRPEGGTFLFLDVGACLDERGLGGFLEDCVDRGLFIAPGPSFGPYPTHVRLCFTATSPEVTLRGVRVLAEIISASRG